MNGKWKGLFKACSCLIKLNVLGVTCFIFRTEKPVYNSWAASKKTGAVLGIEDYGIVRGLNKV